MINKIIKAQEKQVPSLFSQRLFAWKTSTTRIQNRRSASNKRQRTRTSASHEDLATRGLSNSAVIFIILLVGSLKLSRGTSTAPQLIFDRCHLSYHTVLNCHISFPVVQWLIQQNMSLQVLRSLKNVTGIAIPSKCTRIALTKKTAVILPSRKAIKSSYRAGVSPCMTFQ